MLKTIHIYYPEELDNSPLIIRKIIKSWYDNNNDYNITVLSDKTITTKIDLSLLIKCNFYNIKNIDKKISIINIILLNLYGGLIINPFLYCNNNISEFIEKRINKNEFITIVNKNDNIVPYLLYSSPNNYMSNILFKNLLDYYQTITHNSINNIYDTNNKERVNIKREKVSEYNIQHYFPLLLQKNKMLKRLWDDTANINILDCFLYNDKEQSYNIYNNKEMIDISKEINEKYILKIPSNKEFLKLTEETILLYPNLNLLT